MLEQTLPRLHVLVDMSQYKPEPTEHADVPQRHGEVLDIEPSVLSQVGADMHMHSEYDRHDLLDEG